ncbi:hypothetical protein [Bacillus nitratireducens]|uniref:hypothetical protein n=1 Tax=Bacillus nitratireducens TaxID=2026193 RepID=UPI000BF7A9FB|nr:hypothetical protein [Bacillus nitratireducens]MDR4169545.1 hypothetical protein [Bacillus nitratireducens]PFH88363.1 hypothetical protein COI81_14750 [Bacillus cereus]PFM59015.1 hypothetical protein COJ52_13355 [Bacillus cereus]PGS24288.1 hypothetical protein COC55_18165 [Bacillus cereus]
MKTKNQWNKEGLMYGIVGGVLGSMLTASGIILISAFEGPVITNTVTLTAGLGGGIISGTLTLLGVKRTIDLQKEKERLDSVPQRIKYLMDIQESLANWNLHTKVKFILKVRETDLSKSYIVKHVFLADFETGRGKLVEAIYPVCLEVDGVVYTEIKSFLEYLETIREEILDFEEKIVDKEEQEENIPIVDINNFYEGIIKNLETNYDTLITLLKKRLKEYENLLFKYYK